MGKRLMGKSDSDGTNEDESDNSVTENEKSYVIDNDNHSDSSKELDGANLQNIPDVAYSGGLCESGSDEEKDLMNGGSFEVSGGPNGSKNGVSKPGEDQKMEEVENMNCSVFEVVKEACTEPIEVEYNPICSDDISSATELEVFGMEKQKSELQAVGLKFGRTLQVHAARLFLLKTTPIDKIPNWLKRNEFNMLDKESQVLHFFYLGKWEEE